MIGMDLDDGGIGSVGSLGSSIHLGETVYGTHEDSKMVMSEKVQALAGSIYEEFEQMIARYDEDVVKTLMPLLVNVLECLDSAYQSNQEHDVELELLREDNEQLVTQYEREKVARKASEQKLLEIEDAAEGDKKELIAKQEALESIVRMLELKHKNSLEQTGRLEEREGELKREYAKLHERYTDLFKTHMDHMERTKLLLSGGQMGHERQDNGTPGGRIGTNRMNMGRSSGPVSYGFASLEAAEGVDSEPTSPISSMHSSPSLNSELDNVKQTEEKGLETDQISLENKGIVTSPVTPTVAPPAVVSNNNSTPSGTGRLHTKKEQRSGNNLYQELSFQDADALADMDDGADITGGWVHPGEYASSVNDNFYGMGKEVENLIIENTELLATKNALNVVKNDLILKVDELTGETELLREEILQLNMSRTRLTERCTDLEEEVKRLQEANAAAAAVSTAVGSGENDEDMPMVQRKRFTRVEMARVLMERNQYKERFMELQEAVRFVDMMRTKSTDGLNKKSKQSIWTFFSKLFESGSSTAPAGVARSQSATVGGPAPGQHGHWPVARVGAATSSSAAAEPQLRYQTRTERVTAGVGGRDEDATEIDRGRMNPKRIIERKEQYRQVRAHVLKDDNRLQAYGWSLPGKGSGTKVTHSHSGVPVPVPVYCRPLEETSPDLNIWCAAGVNLMGGYTKDGGLMVGGSVFYTDKPPALLPPPPSAASAATGHPDTAAAHAAVNALDNELHLGREGALLETKLSSLVWICTCTETKTAGIVTVIDANNPGEILNSFGVCADRILCIASVPGASPGDYVDYSGSITADVVTIAGDYIPTTLNTDYDPDIDKDGRVTYIAQNATIRNKRDTRISHHHHHHAHAHTGDEPITHHAESGNSSATNPAQDSSDGHTPDTSCNSTEDSVREVGATVAEVEVEEDVAEVEEEEEGSGSGSPGSITVTESEVGGGGGGGGGGSSGSTIGSSSAVGADDSTSSSATGPAPVPAAGPAEEHHPPVPAAPVTSSALASMWMGAQKGRLYVHSSVTNWNQCLHSVQLEDAVISIVHINGRVVVAIANGCLAIFARDPQTGCWDLGRYHLVRLGPPRNSPRCLIAVADRVWCGYKNKVHILDPRRLEIVHLLDAHPRKESEVRELVWLGDGVWVTIRLDSTLRLYHAYTYQHLQDVDIEPYVGKMLGAGKIGFSLVRVTALLISSSRLWIGTSNGVIISVPFSDSGVPPITATAGAVIAAQRGNLPGMSVRVTSSSQHVGGAGGGGSMAAGTYVPYCTMAHAQLSFHGHRDAVRFFVAVPGAGGMSAASTPSEALAAASGFGSGPADGGAINKPPAAMLVMSGGEGYVDFRTGDDGMEDSIIEEKKAGLAHAPKTEQNHLIVWQVIQPY